jgi:ligand-binding SRPBCC domain-containing protein
MMSQLKFAAEIDAPLEAVWAFYDDIAALPLVTPPSTRVRRIGGGPEPSRLTVGARFLLVVRQPPIFVPLRWETIITAHEPPFRFVDEQGVGPFAFWRHEHVFSRTRRGRTLLQDTVTYTPPFGPLGWVADRLFLRRQLTAMFRFRHQATRRLLEPPIATREP